MRDGETLEGREPTLSWWALLTCRFRRWSDRINSTGAALVQLQSNMWKVEVPDWESSGGEAVEGPFPLFFVF
jgi:hypothetical protein